MKAKKNIDKTECVEIFFSQLSIFNYLSFSNYENKHPALNHTLNIKIYRRCLCLFKIKKYDKFIFLDKIVF